jgi:hypothetical protein
MLGVTIIDHDFYMAMEYCEKGSLLDWLRSSEADKEKNTTLLEISRRIFLILSLIRSFLFCIVVVWLFCWIGFVLLKQIK